MTEHELFFEDNYTACRERFRTSANSRRWQTRCLHYEAPNQSDLTIDIAVRDFDSVSAHTELRPSSDNERKHRSGSQQVQESSGVKRVLVVSSGLHGVEGYVGSAIQAAMLDGHIELAGNCRVILIHGLNPFGFAQDRRFDESNIDLNRNFLLDGQVYSGCHPTYRRLDAFLNPSVPTSKPDWYYPKAVAYLLRFGMKQLRGAIAEGQYEFPKGLFFGGSGPSQTQSLLRNCLANILHKDDRVMHLDVHSGLGGYGKCKLLFDYALPQEAKARLRHSFSGTDCSFENDDAATYQARGSLGNWCRAQQFCASYDVTCMEYGTYNSVHMLRVLREENLCFHSSSDEVSRHASRMQLREAFCPRDRAWRRKVIERAAIVVRQAEDFLRS
jgi:hypothetical protein